MLSTKQIWRTRMIEKVAAVKEPQADWDAKTRITFYFITMPQGHQLTSDRIAIAVYNNDSKHTVEMVDAAIRDLLLNGILATKTELPQVFYRLHPDARLVLGRVKRDATHH